MANGNNLLSNNHEQQVLNKFLVDNTELEKLTSILSRFNVFNVLKIEEAEIRHSNVLAWLIDPQGSHGLGQLFIRRLLSTILLESEVDIIDLSPVQVELMNLLDVEVEREWKNIDILAYSPSNKWIMLVENKIRAKATKQQLDKYIEVVKREFKDYVIIPILLTLDQGDGDEIAGLSDYINWSHSQTYPIISHIVHQRQDRIPEDAKVFLNHYLSVLRRLTMQDQEIATLCKTIYRKHKDAIDLIVEYSTATQFVSVVEEFLAINKELLHLASRPRNVWFIPKSWGETMPPCASGWKHLSKGFPIACWFVLKQTSEKMGLIIEVGPMEKSDKRIELIDTFGKKDFRCPKNALRKESKYTRVYSQYMKIKDIDDQKEIETIIGKLWEKSRTSIDATGKIIGSFKW